MRDLFRRPLINGTPDPRLPRRHGVHHTPHLHLVCRRRLRRLINLAFFNLHDSVVTITA